MQVRRRKFALTSLSKSRNCSTSDLLWIATGYLLPDAANQARITTLIGTLEQISDTLVQAAKRWLPIETSLLLCRAHDLRRSEWDMLERT